MHDLEEVFGAEGPLAQHIKDFRTRDEQVAMAEQVWQALRRGGRLIIEAGTGTGKTFAYLVPALLAGRRTVVSTGTRNLQDQLFHRDLPVVTGALGRPVKVALLKGRANYLCLHRLELAQQQAADRGLRRDLARALGRVRDWARITRKGDIAELAQLSDADPVWPLVTSTRDNCLGAQCELFERCHVVHARRDAQAADIVVVNHHLLMADLVLKEEGFSELLPGADAIIVDEAHQLPEVAANFLGFAVSSRQLQSLSRDLIGELVASGGNGELGSQFADELESALNTLREVLQTQRERCEFDEWPDALLESLTQLRSTLDDLIAALAEAAREHVGLANLTRRAAEASRRIATLLEINPPSVAALGAGADVGTARVGSVGVGSEIDTASAGAGGTAAATGSARAAHATSTMALADAMDDGDAADTEAHKLVPAVRWAQRSMHGVSLHWVPLDVAGQLSRLMDAQGAAWICTSATLAVGESFEHFSQRLGLEDAATARYGSPFDYESQALLYMPRGLAPPSSRQYTQEVIDRALPVLRASGGRAFLLFTSHRALRDGAQALLDRLGPVQPFPVLVQGDAPREVLLTRFREHGNAVLLGTSSFWEGVDVKGPALSVVVIDKLPFAAPDDPVLKARLAAVEQRGGNAFLQEQVPQAVIALKQGVGRLIRDSDDFGVIMLCDPRLRSRGYGRLFLEALPHMPRTDQLADVQQFLAKWLVLRGIDPTPVDEYHDPFAQAPAR